MSLNIKNYIKIFFLFLIIFSFFLGYALRENSTGAGSEFYHLSWPIIQSFKKDFMFTINNYGLFEDGTIPFSHIINAYLNPFSNDDVNFQLSITIISFLIFLVFASILKRTFLNVSPVDILLTASVFLLLPFFRTIAFWGNNENFGWLFLILSLYFFAKIKKDITKIPDNKDLLNTFLFCLLSSCALYARQALIFLPISYMLYLFFNKANKKIIVTSIVSFSILSIPGLLLIFAWGDIYDTKNVDPGEVYGRWIHHKYILRNIPILLSFFGFYLLPIIVIEFFNSKTKDFFQKYYKSFLFAIIVFAILTKINFLDYLGDYSLSGGAILKLNYLIAKNNFLLLLIFSSIGFSIITRIINEDRKNNIIFLFPIFVLYSVPQALYQEYAEPLVLIMFFLGLKTSLRETYFKKVSLSNAILLSYFSIYLISSIYFKHFAFDSLEKWRIFLNS